MKQVKAMIADDEAALREFLKRRLAILWPEMTICGEASNGLEALELADRHCPEVAFLDIKMPGLSGIEVARKLPEGCLPVFITAFDRFAIEAFEAGGVDYLLKPVSDVRLEKTIARLKTRVSAPLPALQQLDDILGRLASSVPSGGREYLQWIKVRHKDKIRLISVQEVDYFNSADKYTMVRSGGEEFLIKKSIKELIEELSPDQFWQIHRATLVNVTKIEAVTRSLTGSYDVHLTGLPETLSVSRAFSHLFKQM
jgi:DNA-binding LytR/AlgR family response regulator